MKANLELRNPRTVILGVLGVDAHVVGNKIIAHALETLRSGLRGDTLKKAWLANPKYKK